MTTAVVIGNPARDPSSRASIDALMAEWAPVFGRGSADSCAYMTGSLERTCPRDYITASPSRWQRSFQTVKTENVTVRGRRATATFANGAVARLSQVGATDYWAITGLAR